MRSAYYSDLCSKFMIENTILKMEYAEVRVFSISDKVGSEKQDIRFPWNLFCWLGRCLNLISFFLCNRTWPLYATWTSCCWLPISICPLITCSGCLLSLPCCSVSRWWSCNWSPICSPAWTVILFLFCVCTNRLEKERQILMKFFSCNSMTSSYLQVLEADNNAIENLEGVYHLPKLEEVLLKNNSILKLVVCSGSPVILQN